jgi:hypothetical protein
MRMKAVYCCFVCLVGCAQAPRSSTYPYTEQPQMQAAHHWQGLASQVVGELIARIRAGYVSSTEAVYVQCDDQSPSVYIPCEVRSPYRTPFSQAFHSFLITELTKQGIPVSFNQNNRLKIDWALQPVVHNAYRIKPLPHSEVIITTTITESGDILWRDANIFYINDEDWWHYWSRAEALQKSYAVVDR